MAWLVAPYRKVRRVIIPLHYETKQYSRNGLRSEIATIQTKPYSRNASGDRATFYLPAAETYASLRSRPWIDNLFSAIANWFLRSPRQLFFTGVLYTFVRVLFSYKYFIECTTVLSNNWWRSLISWPLTSILFSIASSIILTGVLYMFINVLLSFNTFIQCTTILY